MIDNAGPVTGSERIGAIDLLRGFALLGILIMNIQVFAMVDAAYFNPLAYGDYTGIHKTVHVLSHVLADQKFMTIFSMLFGAGMVLMLTRVDDRGESPQGIHYRRMFFLLMIGVVHAYLLWHGDILVYYALCGMIVYPFRHRSIRTQLILGTIMLSIASGLYIFSGWSVPYWPEEAVRGFMADWNPGPEAVANEVAIMGHTWQAQLEHRITKSLEFHTVVFLFWGLWRAGGLMLMGMALYRMGVFSARRSNRYYAALVAVGAFVGLPIVAYGYKRFVDGGWDMQYVFFIGAQYNYWGSILVSLGWTGVVMLVYKAGLLRPLTSALAAVGRMALSNYLGHTVICTLIFYGHGLGLFGQVERAGQIMVVAGVWAVQLIVSPIWLRSFQFGPMEWLWRSLTYGERQPFMR